VSKSSAFVVEIHLEEEEEGTMISFTLHVTHIASLRARHSY